MPPPGIIAYASLTNILAREVTVTIVNISGGDWTPDDGTTATIDIWRHT
jgi:hypothetical protein